jgi:endonuclease-3
MDLKAKAIEAHERLVATYGSPEWRTPLPPIDELVSTILSQATSDTNRDKGFYALKARWATWEDVRDAPVKEIVKAITPAGLANQKGPRIKKVLQEITALRGALNIDFLKETSSAEAIEWLTQFHGIGVKTASIVLQFSLDLPAFPVDTHVHRVTGRLGLRPEKLSAEKSHAYLEAIFPPETYYVGHLNIIRLGREVCKARNPLCEECPLTDICDYYQNLPE